MGKISSVFMLLGLFCLVFLSVWGIYAYCNNEVRVSYGGKIITKDVDHTWRGSYWMLGFEDGTWEDVPWSIWDSVEVGDTYSWQETRKGC